VTQSNCWIHPAGPEEELKPFLQTLKNENIFVKEVDTLGIAYHSPALEPFSGTLKKSLEALIPDPKPRGKTWLSTSYPLDSEDPNASICGPEYHVRDSAFLDLLDVCGVLFVMQEPKQPLEGRAFCSLSRQFC
jgi:hypothetical protein